MGNGVLKIEDKEIKMWHKTENTLVECGIKNNVFVSVLNEQVTFSSEIYRYSDLSIVVNREPRFREFYYAIAIYNESEDQAWPLLTLPAEYDTNIKRFGDSSFVIWTQKQCSFCKLYNKEKQDNVTVDFDVLKDIRILPGDYILLSTSQILGESIHTKKRTVTTLAVYEPSGRLNRTIFEFYDDEGKTYDYELDMAQGRIIVVDKSKNEKGEVKVIKFEDFKTVNSTGSAPVR